MEAIMGRRFDGSPADKARDIILNVRKDFPSLESSEDVTFLSGENKLAGHIYRADMPKGLILITHGINSSSQDDTAELQDYFLRNDYDVFSFDLTASGESEGNGVLGLHQAAYDIKAAVDYLYSREDLNTDSMAFVGFSWGAYGVAASLDLDLKAMPKAICTFAGFASPEEEMVSSAKRYIGVLADASRLQMGWAIQTRCGEDANLSAIEAMANHPEVDWTLVQGDLDTTVPLESSLYQKATERNLIFHPYLREGFKHQGLWRTKDAWEAYQEAMAYYESIQGEEKALEKLEKYVQSNGVKTRASALDESLLDQIEAHIAASLGEKKNQD